MKPSRSRKTWRALWPYCKRSFVDVFILALCCATCAAPRENETGTALELFAILGAVTVVQIAAANAARTCSESSRSNQSNLGRPRIASPSFRAEDSTALVIGDSTAAIGLFVSGHYSQSTEVLGLPGATCCDMAEQLPAAQAAAPEKVMVSTACGNDILSGLSGDLVVANGRYLFDQVAARYGGAQLVGVAIHPTLFDTLNVRKEETNAELRAHVEGLGGCWIPMLSIFGVSAGERAPASLMLDTIHYNETVYAELRTAAESLCGMIL